MDDKEEAEIWGVAEAGAAESAEREAHRKTCRYYIGPAGMCRGLSGIGRDRTYDVRCTAECECPRLRKYDKKNKIKTGKNKE